MSLDRWHRAACLAVGAMLILAPMASGFEFFGPALDGSEEPSWASSWDRFAAGWRGVLHWRAMAVQVLELAVSTGLAAAIAFHPRNWSDVVTEIDMADQPKTLLVYAMVATMVAEIVQVYPAMAFVVFGIGGLLRFRTDLGAPKLTGRAILVTIIGLAVGLELFPLAVVGTAFGWLLIFVLEQKVVVRLRIRKLPLDRVVEASKKWEELVSRLGGQLISETPNTTTGEIELLILIPSNLDREVIQENILGRIPEDLRGKLEIKIG